MRSPNSVNNWPNFANVLAIQRLRRKLLLLPTLQHPALLSLRFKEHFMAAMLLQPLQLSNPSAC